MKLKRDGNIAKLFKKKMENKQRQVIRDVDWLQWNAWQNALLTLNDAEKQSKLWPGINE